MARLLTLFVSSALLAVVTVAPALADKRVALVVGNSAYKHAGELTNPRNDAADMSATLKKVGFQVIDGFDLDKASFDRKIRDFANMLSGADVGLFFYAGHGLQVAAQNYLVPTDAELTTAASLEFEMVRLDVVHRIMEQAAPTNVLFLDACRNNPLARNLARALGTRSAEIGRGLAPVESGSGSLISFSTQPGNIALDGTGRNSPFAAALAKQISTSSDDLSALLIAVRNDVMNATQRKQVPWEHSALTGRFYFNAARQAPVATAAPTAAWRLSEAAEAWDRTKDTKNIAALELFIGRYKDTYYAGLARLRVEELKKQQAAVSTTPSPQPAEKRVPAEDEVQKAARAQRDVQEGDRHYFGRGVPRDYVKAREGYEQAAAAGHVGAMNGLGLLYENGLGVDRDYAKARQWYEKSVAGGNPFGMINLGRLYREGWGVPQDYGKARGLYEKAIAAGNTTAMVSLGWLYNNGWGVARDYAKARGLYEKAVATGNGGGMNNLGALYEQGQGVSKDQGKAREWFEKAAAAGDDFGMNNLGRYYQNGWGVPQDYGKAREWFEKAAVAGNRFGRANLAKLLDEGKGGAADFPRAAKLLLEAALSGNSETIEALQGDMKKWSNNTRTELKRELVRLGHYKGPNDDTWDGAAHTAVGRYLARGR